MLAFLAAASVVTAGETLPRRAPAIFYAGEYALTLQVPKGATYCPLPKDWVGSNHGTTLFLRPPRTCGGIGYPSSSRAFAPEDTPRIAIYYGYDVIPDEDKTPEPPCKRVGSARLLGHTVPICPDDAWNLGPQLRALTARAKYDADAPAETSITLITTPGRMTKDLATLRGLLRTVHPCRAKWESRDLNGHVTGTNYIGHGERCPSAGRWF